MLLRFLLVACFTVCSTHARTVAEMKQWFIQMGTACNKKHPITPEEITSLRKQIVPESNNVKCLLACVYKKPKWLTPDNDFDIDEAKEMIEKDLKGNAKMAANVKRVFDACMIVNGVTEFPTENTDCERAYLMTRCLFQHAPKFGVDLKKIMA